MEFKMPIKMKKLIKPQKPIKIKTYKLNIKGNLLKKMKVLLFSPKYL